MTPDYSEIEEIKAQKVCVLCIDEEYLSKEISKTGIEAQCNYCEHESNVISMEEFSIKVEEAIDTHFVRTPVDPVDYEWVLAKEGKWERHGEPINGVISDYAEISEEIAEDVRKIIDYRTYDYDALKMGEENPFDEDAHYEERGPNDFELQGKWAAFERSIKNESRFFSRFAQNTLDTIFANVKDISSASKVQVYIDIGPETETKRLYRARVFQSEDDLKKTMERPDIHLGPPPSRLAVAGRMNPEGIAVFYGATTAELAIAEVRPPVSSRVVTGEFIIQQPLKLLDVDALSELYVRGSIFDSSYMERLEYAQFFQRLCTRISRPVLPNDEAQEYLVTQAISEYLSEMHEPRLAGIIFESAQMKNNARNIVLFHHAAKVEAIVLPADTELSSSTSSSDEDGPYPNYSVTEEEPHEDDKKRDGDEDADFRFSGLQYDPLISTDYDGRENSLKVNLESISVHHVSGVKYESESFSVSRHRWKRFKKGEEPF
ncbi:MAG: RES domain-containing protein [Nitrospinae bacterium]|nr:RES domain-containing protein [Nitrospinota bacterium]